MRIIKLGNQQIAEALNLVWEVFSEFEAPEYSEQGVAAFKEFISMRNIEELYGKGALTFWGCYDGNTLAGVIAAKGVDHICLLFARKEYHRRGIARRLFEKVLLNCRTCQGILHITVNSSPYAVEAYRHLGFTPLSGEITNDGIRFTPMEYLLSRD